MAKAHNELCWLFYFTTGLLGKGGSIEIRIKILLGFISGPVATTIIFIIIITSPSITL